MNTHLRQQGIQIPTLGRIHPRRVQGVRVLFGNVQEKLQDNLPILILSIVFFHGSLELLFEALAPRLCRLQDFFVRGWD